MMQLWTALGISWNNLITLTMLGHTSVMVVEKAKLSVSRKALGWSAGARLLRMLLQLQGLQRYENSGRMSRKRLVSKTLILPFQVLQG